MEADMDTTEQPTQNNSNHAEYQPVSDTGEGIAFRMQLLERMDTVVNQQRSRCD